MKATISQGCLVVSSENGIDAYALKKWHEDFGKGCAELCIDFDAVYKTQQCPLDTSPPDDI